LLKFFRVYHRDEQIGEQREGNKADNNVFHKFLEFFAPVGVNFTRHKKQDQHADIDHVQHNFSNPQRCHNGRNNAITFLFLGELEAADFADQRIALPIACEISCRAWP
jgi:hypothetical protein